MQHVDTFEILAYVSGKMGEEESARMEIHCAECEACAKKVSAHFMIRDHFDTVFDSWTAEAHGQALAAEQLADALDQAASAEGSDALRERIRTWVATVQARAGVALTVAVDTTRHAAKIVRENMDLLNPLTIEPALRPSIVRTRGAVATRGERHVHGKTAQDKILVEIPGDPSVSVSMDPLKNCVRVASEMLEKPWPLVLLIPQGEGRPQVKEFRLSLDKTSLMAEFENVESGEYLLVIESQAGED